VIPLLEPVFPQAPPEFDEARWLEACNKALAILKQRGLLQFEEDLEEIALVVVDDAEIARLHDAFLNDPTPTDVITFHHGEIVISQETAAREALARGISLEEELTRYAVHGVLHLIGYDDHEPEGHAAMHALQEDLVRESLRGESI